MAASPYLAVTNPVYTHTFATPIGEKQITEVAIRKPNGRDLLEIGSPVVFDPYSGKPSLDYPISFEMVSRLSNIPVSVLQTGDIAEMIDFFWLLSSFFMKGQQTFLPDLAKQKAESVEQAASPET